ncbi:hypothetical protein AB4143_17040 [Vibrio breoganii]|uniref:hypothetical protein n=1 Tax=Vibrio breoganii TaxID=553239 RepID=UPI000C819414|nr:hypothetical protein [Vibrio breoganii]PMF83552.1 hypothetical protein BCV08_14790 [Vibrio breoganii]PMM79873.1 hypothetical protein BCT45_16085 [Vibrio breoganii]
MSVEVIEMMRFFTKNRSSKNRIIEESVYEQVADELDNGDIRRGLWTKARGLSDGDANKCESIYIQLRAESLVDEAKISHEIHNHPSTKRAKEEREKQTANERLRERTAQQKLEVENRKAKEKEDELKREKLKLRERLASIDKVEFLQELLSGRDLVSKVRQDGSFQPCIVCDFAKTRNKVDGVPICNTCLRKPSLV